MFNNATATQNDSGPWTIYNDNQEPAFELPCNFTPQEAMMVIKIIRAVEALTKKEPS